VSINILLVEDHQIVREGLRSLLEKQTGFRVVAEAEDGRAAVQVAREMALDIVIMDVSMPDLNGIEATRQILAHNPDTKVIALSMHADKRFVVQMLRAGASGYVLKNSAFGELELAIRTVLANRTYLSPKIADLIVKEYVHHLANAEPSVFSILTPRELEVLQLLSEGKTTKEIAFSLQVSVKTIETYRQQIMAKLGVHSIAELTKYAIREGLTAVDR
jgi:DNA-binding NarL/FixJ family response regulator